MANRYGHDLRLAGIVEVALGDPRRRRPRQEVDEVGIVHGEDRIEAVVVGLDDRDAGRDELVVQDVAALGLLVAGQPHAEPVAAVGCMPAVARRPHHRHRRAPRRRTLAKLARALQLPRCLPATATARRELGVVFGPLPTGAHNAITDVPGVRVGHVTRWSDGADGVARTGVTAIVPDDLAQLYLPADGRRPAVLNGVGELTGSIAIGRVGHRSTRRSC